jgi:hypothetical protein
MIRRSKWGALRALSLCCALFSVHSSDLSAQEIREWIVSTEPVVEIGLIDGEPTLIFSDIRAARLLPDGRIVVADGMESVVRIFSPAGEFLNEMGGKGDGPGEFRWIAGMEIMPPDTVRVWDADAHRITTFLADGSLVGTQRFAPMQRGGPSGVLDGLVGWFADGDVALSWTVAGQLRKGQIVPDRTILGRFDPAGSLRYLLGEGEGLHRSGRGPDPFSPFPHATVHNDSVYFMNGVGGRIAVLDPDGAGVSRVIEVSASPVEVREAWPALQAKLRDEGDMALLGRIPDPLLTHTPSLAGMLIDDRGFLWVKTYDPTTDCVYLGRPPGPGGEWIIVETKGRTVAKAVLPDGLVPLHITGNRVLGVSRGPLDVQKVVVHILER